MNSERWQRLQQLFDRAIELPTNERDAFLESGCDGDDALRRQVESLILASHQADSFAGGIVEHVLGAAGADDELREGTTIGPYRVIRQLGVGGMGTVYLAERDDDAFSKKVAVKLARQGLADREMQRRFRTERQILAALEHENIARVLDGGTLGTQSGADGRAYVVMEYVDGEPIDRYCDREKLSTDERLELFVQVCRAVHDAHRNLIVHRDIKPSNILVTDEGVPKLLDFGIAKLLRPGLLYGPVAATQDNTRLLTPAYASPEQIRGTAITTGSDIYSLGVLLYELLTGHRPYRLTTEEPRELERAICEQDPERPSTVATSESETTTAAELSRSRATDPVRLRRKLRGDLDNIVLMALRKDPHDRYASVEQLAEDIRRHLAHEPVVARPPSFGYRVGKYVRRHRLGVGLVALALLALVGGTVGTTIGLVRAKRAEAEALREANAAKRVTDFMIGMFQAPTPGAARGEELLAREVVDRGYEELVAGLAEEPEIRTRLLIALSNVYSDLGIYDRSLELADRAHEAQRDLPADHPDRVWTFLRTGTGHAQSGDFDSAKADFERALEILEVQPDPDPVMIAEANYRLGSLHLGMSDYDDARPYHERALALRREALDPDHADVALSLRAIGLVKAGPNTAPDGLDELERAQTLLETSLGTDHPVVADNLDSIGLVHMGQGEIDLARPLFERALEIRERVLGPNHPTVAFSYQNIGRLIQRADPEGALRMYDRALEIRSATLGPDHRRCADVIESMAIVHIHRREFDRAEKLLRRSLGIYESSLGPENSETLETCYNLAAVEVLRGNHREALTWLTRSAEGGFPYSREIAQSDWDPLRAYPEFERIETMVAEREAAAASSAGGE